jgi:hypothetical protein
MTKTANALSDFNQAVTNYLTMRDDLILDTNTRHILKLLYDDVMDKHDSLSNAKLLPHQWDMVIQDIIDVARCAEEDGIIPKAPLKTPTRALQ